MILFIPLWFLLCVGLGFIGVGKKMGYWGVFFISLFFSPLIGLIVGLASSDNRSNIESDKAASLMRRKNFSKAKEKLDLALKIDNRNISAMFNYACYHSLKGEIQESQQMLSKAVESGYSNFQKIESDNDFLNLRNSEGYDEFKQNGYKTIQKVISQETELDKLQKLNELRKEGAITEEEFDIQKKKLLSV